MGLFEALDEVDNPLHRFAGAIASGWTRMFGSRNERQLREIIPLVEAINALEPETEKLADAALAERTKTLRARIQKELKEQGCDELTAQEKRLRLDGHVGQRAARPVAQRIVARAAHGGEPAPVHAHDVQRRALRVVRREEAQGHAIAVAERVQRLLEVVEITHGGAVHLRDDGAA